MARLLSITFTHESIYVILKRWLHFAFRFDHTCFRILVGRMCNESFQILWSVTDPMLEDVALDSETEVVHP